MGHDLESGARRIARLRALVAEAGRDPERFQVCLGGPVTGRDDVHRWEDLGVTRLIVSPWARSPQAVAGLRDFARLVGLSP
jgi:alkanesulfonate monooxygenase SsuD/methylene tetrahydromethanopterin reductase-like flavin-dependent oxidoreductase (luciferase family)